MLVIAGFGDRCFHFHAPLAGKFFTAMRDVSRLTHPVEQNVMRQQSCLAVMIGLLFTVSLLSSICKPVVR
jgi:hypothetical protein